MVRTGQFTSIALVVLAAGCRADARIQLLVPAPTDEPDGQVSMEGGSGGSQEPAPPRAGTQAGASGRPSGHGGRISTPPDAGMGSAGTSEPPPAPMEDAGRPPPTGEEPIPGLILRYDFSGDGTTVPDLVGDNDATLIGGATLSPDRDHVVLDGVDDYVDMPNGVISSLESATFIAWIAWSGGPCWQRIFDFGSNEGGEDATGFVRTSLFMTPVACGGRASDATYAVMAEFGRTQYQMNGPQPLVEDFTIMVALVVDAERRTFTMYNDGVAVAEAETPFALEDLIDENNWLGRSQWPQDATFNGLYGDFRIYDRALTPDEIATLYNRRPNGL